MRTRGWVLAVSCAAATAHAADITTITVTAAGPDKEASLVQVFVVRTGNPIVFASHGENCSQAAYERRRAHAPRRDLHPARWTESLRCPLYVRAERRPRLGGGGLMSRTIIPLLAVASLVSACGSDAPPAPMKLSLFKVTDGCASQVSGDTPDPILALPFKACDSSGPSTTIQTVLQ